MNIKRVKTDTIAMLLAGAFVAGVGAYTDNGGFQLAGGILLVVAAILALKQAGSERQA